MAAMRNFAVISDNFMKGYTALKVGFLQTK